MTRLEKSLFGKNLELKLKAEKVAGLTVPLAFDRQDLKVPIMVSAKTLSFLTENILTIQDDIKFKQYEFGKFGSINFRRYHGNRKYLLDGSVITAGDPVGVVNLLKNLDSIDGYNLFDFSRVFFRDFARAMVILGYKIERKQLPVEIKAITGISHLAGERASKRMGFDVYTVWGQLQRCTAAFAGTLFTRELYQPDESFLRSFWLKYKRVHQVWMSSEGIVRNRTFFKDLNDRLS